MTRFLAPVYTTNTVPASDTQKLGEAQVVEQHLFPKDSGLNKTNIINKSTRKLNPTKGLDKVEDATSRINNITKTLESRDITITKHNANRIGHLDIKIE